jgi:DNA-binding NtrC family response regulator
MGPAALRVLVVDDDPDQRANLCDILELDGYHIETAGTVAEVAARSDWSAIDAILLDRRLPDGTAEEPSRRCARGPRIISSSPSTPTRCGPAWPASPSGTA